MKWGGDASVVPCNYALEYHIRTMIVVPVNVLVYTYLGRIGPARIPARSTYYLVGCRDHWDLGTYVRKCTEPRPEPDPRQSEPRPPSAPPRGNQCPSQYPLHYLASA